MSQTGQKGEPDAASARGDRVFVNHLAVEVSLSEFRINIGQKGPGGQSDDSLYRFVTTPHHFQMIQRKVDQAADRYISEFGSISQEGEADG
ncbi:MAG: hypothetical protein V3V15_01235 [Sphingorhabdus sp.]